MDSNSKSEFLYDKLHFFLTTKQKDELKHAFDLLDDKGSGVIDIEDIVIIVHSLDLQVKPGSVSKLLRRYDPHNSGALDFRGFLCVVEKLLFSKFTNDDIYKAFKAYCKSRGDAILLEDLKLINKDLNEDLSDEELNEMFRLVDLNGDGIVDLKEFKEIMRKSDFSKFFEDH